MESSIVAAIWCLDMKIYRILYGSAVSATMTIFLILH
jgi:hypothetical protein